MCVIVAAVLQTLTLKRGATIANASTEQSQASVATRAEIIGPVRTTTAHSYRRRGTTGGISEIPVVAKRLAGCLIRNSLGWERYALFVGA